MDEKTMAAYNAIVKEIQNTPEEASIDYRQMTPPCGLPCFRCAFYFASKNPKLQVLMSETYAIPMEHAACKGCRNEGGKCSHLPMECRLYPCAEDKGIEFCYQCSDFPCDYLHPYADKADLVWHNTKVFNLCLIKKMGLEAWAKDKAHKVRDAYYFGNWTL